MRKVPTAFQNFVKNKQKQFYKNMLVSLLLGMILAILCQTTINGMNGNNTESVMDIWSCAIYGLVGVIAALLVSFATVLVPEK